MTLLFQNLVTNLEKGWETYAVYIILASLGLVLLTQGTRLFRFWLALTGLVSGFQTGHNLATHYDWKAMTYWIITISLAVMGMILFALALKISFVLAGAFVGFYLTWYLSNLYQIELPMVVFFIIAVIVGYVAGALRFHFLNLATAITGSLLLLDAGMGAWKKAAPLSILSQTIEEWKKGERLVLLLVFGIVAVVGYLYQRKHAPQRH